MRLQERFDEAADRERTVADLLRHGLLPPELPTFDDLALAASFQPGADVAVGGDFYDAFLLEDGKLAVVIGDVCGNGPEAASVSGQVRHTLRALAETDDEPAAVMARLDSLLRRTALEHRFCTAVFDRIERSTGGGVAITLSCAGHPPPLILRADGSVETVTCRGSLLGVLDDGRWHDHRVDLATGDTLILYTDGVIEARDERGRLFGEARLRKVVGTCDGSSPAQLVDAIKGAALDHAGTIRDDIAILAATAT
jgi:serine phosphatase RsbU (regulator of sigma subunit)